MDFKGLKSLVRIGFINEVAVLQYGKFFSYREEKVSLMKELCCVDG